MSELDDLAALIHAPIEEAFVLGCPDWWPPHEEWAREAARAVIEAGWRRDVRDD